MFRLRFVLLLVAACCLCWTTITVTASPTNDGDEQLNKFSADGKLQSCLNTPVLSSGNRTISILQGNLNLLPPKLRQFLEEKIELCQPKNIHICSGSEKETLQLTKLMQDQKVLIPLPKYNNCYLARTNPADVARVESKTFLVSENKRDSVPDKKENVPGKLGNWLSSDEFKKAIKQRFPGCMKGRTMYVIPFSMGPVGSPLAKIGVQLTDSPYVVLSMKVMTRMGDEVLRKLSENTETPFVRALHSVGTPESGVHEFPNWPCDPARTIILHRLETNEIVSYGSGYGGNSLLGKKCLALRIGSSIAKKEGWLAEHMLILGITNPEGKTRYIAAAFPSACGKTNLAMLTPTLPGYKVTCVGDDIAWMKFNSKGELRAINPENGFFGVAPGTSHSTNPNAMKTIYKNTIFTNVAMTSDGGVFWEGLESEIPANVKITDWLGREWSREGKTPAAHPNSRFCTPAAQCPIIDPKWEDPEGVPIDAILFGGRRPVGVPLIYESLNWKHGVYVGASMRSETTAAAEHKGKVIMNDPFAMRPFFGYNFGHYLRHWLNIGERPNVKLPKIFHVNWFRKDANGKFLWPGYGENTRVLDWILQRLDNKENIAVKTPIGYIPAKGALKMDGLTGVDFDPLFHIDKQFWKQEVNEVTDYLNEQVGSDLPAEILQEAEDLKKRLEES